MNSTIRLTKIIRVTTVPESLMAFCGGLGDELRAEGYELVAVSSPGEKLERYAASEGVRTIAVPMERRISPFKDFKSLWLMWRVMRREKPAIVHSMTPKAGLISMVAGWLARVPIRIHTFTGLVFPTATGFKRRILMVTDSITCACATHIIPEGEGVKNDLIQHHITRKPLKVLGYGNVRGIDLDYYRRSEAVVEKANSIRKAGIFTFIFIGRIVRDKGINELVKAFSKVHSQYPATRLILVGPSEDNLDPISENTKQAILWNKAIETVGRQDDVRPWLAAADALVFPSYREGFPNVVIEAGAMELPSIVTDINGSREIIRDGQNGIIVPPQNAEALFQAMKRFIENPDEVKHMAADARPHIASRYEQGFVRKCLKEFYQKVLSSYGTHE